MGVIAGPIGSAVGDDQSTEAVGEEMGALVTATVGLRCTVGWTGGGTGVRGGGVGAMGVRGGGVGAMGVRGLLGGDTGA